MYLEGLRNEGILRDGEEAPESEATAPPQRPEFGKPQELGPQGVDLNRVSQRVVALRNVNWGPPE